MSKKTIIFFMFIWIIWSTTALDYDYEQQLEKLATTYKYKYENHSVYTTDGFILTVGRLLPDELKCSQLKGVVLLGHGLGNNGEQYALSPNFFAYRLVDACFEVWLMSARGTRYSCHHKQLTFHDREFWNFAQDDVALEDLKNVVDKIRTFRSGRIHYAGFSQATSQFLILCAALPQYQNYFMSAHLMAPVVFLRSLDSFYTPIIQSSILQKITFIPELVNRPIFKPEGYLQGIWRELCSNNRPICLKISKTNCANMTDSALWGAHFPDAISLRQLAQLFQWKLATFQRYDYGPKRNIQYYGSIIPPALNISSINVPIFLYYGSGDPITGSVEANELAKILPDVRIVHEAKRNRPGHGDCPTDMGLQSMDVPVISNMQIIIKEANQN